MAKKKKAISVKKRVAEHRQRQVESGKKQVNVTLDNKTIAKLDKQAKAAGTSRAELISQLINNNVTSNKEPVRKPPAKNKKAKGGKCHLCGTWRPDSELNNLLRGESRYHQAQCKDFTDCAIKRGILHT